MARVDRLSRSAPRRKPSPFAPSNLHLEASTMKRLPRILPCVALACSITLPLLWVSSADAAPKGKSDAAMKGDAADSAAPAGGDAAAPASATGADAPAADTATPATPAPDATPGTDAATEPAATEPATTEPAPDEAAASANKPLADQVDDFWHYGEVARYDLQAQLGKRIIGEGQKNPEELLKI